jgi:molybdate transport system substrate-binding protein
MAPRRPQTAQSGVTVPTFSRLRGLPALLAVPLAALAACGGQPTQGSNPAHTITLFAAASTATVMQREIGAYAALHHGVHVDGDYEGTQALLTKLQADPSGADVFLSADRAHMDQAVRRGLAAAPVDLAGNRLVIAVPRGNPAQVSSIADLARPGLRLVLADHSVPAGGYAEQALHSAESHGDAPAGFAAKALANAVSRESDVEQVVAKVASGEVDAGVVYATDAVANARVQAVQIPAGDQPPTVYPVAVTSHSHDASAAHDFLDFLLSGAGRRILAEAGFTVPPVASAAS